MRGDGELRVPLNDPCVRPGETELDVEPTFRGGGELLEVGGKSRQQEGVADGMMAREE